MTQDSLFGARADAGTDPAPAPDAERTAPEQLDEVLVFCDGGSRGNPGPSAIGAVVLDPSTDPPRLLAEVSECIGVTTNNVAEYRALIAGLRAAAPYHARRIRVRADSKLVIEQVKGTWKVKQPHLRPLLEEARALLADYAVVDLRHVPRAENFAADALVNAALDASAPG
ncbi:MAG: ribonuclease [Actinomycetia bacterium]|nr:ribonuclease [Actinomycetes bacterium]MDQ1462996.1 ribonuclease [Actinomycetota bacterium]